MGAGGSRGYGMQVAQGEYLAFVDNDDVLEKDYLKNMIDNVQNSNNIVDIVTCNFCKVDEENKKILYKRRFKNASCAMMQSIAP